jgi:predicted RNase H-like HicB family nuclease
MERRFTLDYWLNDNWYVRRMKEVPGVFSQGETLDELEQNIVDAYRMVMAEEEYILPNPRFKLRKSLYQCESKRSGCYLKRSGVRHDPCTNPRPGKSAPSPQVWRDQGLALSADSPPA